MRPGLMSSLLMSIQIQFRRFFILVLFLFAPLASAVPYLCSATITLQGDSLLSFWARGTDAWTGEGHIECLKKGSSRRANSSEIINWPVYAHYEGWGPGYGSTEASRVDLFAEDFELSEVAKIYGSYRTLGASPTGGGHFFLITQNSNHSVVWSLSSASHAVNMSTFLQSGQLILRRYKPKKE